MQTLIFCDILLDYRICLQMHHTLVINKVFDEATIGCKVSLRGERGRERARLYLAQSSIFHLTRVFNHIPEST